MEQPVTAQPETPKQPEPEVEGFNKELAFRQSEITKTRELLFSQIEDLLICVNRQRRFLTSTNALVGYLPELPPDPPPTVIPDFMIVTVATNLLSRLTCLPWSPTKLHKVAKHLEWRPGYHQLDEDKADPLYFICGVNSVGYSYKVYTRRAIEYIRDNTDECWEIATSKEIITHE